MSTLRGKPGAYALLEGHLAYTFEDVTLLETALTHKSYVNEHDGAYQDNERLEFLGDAVLSLAAAHLLMEACPERSEGELSSLRSRVVSEPALATVAAGIGLGEWLFLGKGEESTGGRHKTSLLSDALEAMLGAIYTERGFETVLRVVKRLLGAQVQHVAQSVTLDYKSQLQELLQGRLRTRPRYQTLSEEGPDHDKTFEVAVWVQDRQLGRGRGKSKREAEQRAAALVLEKLRRAPADELPAGEPEGVTESYSGGLAR